jgi:hypothetical protein
MTVSNKQIQKITIEEAVEQLLKTRMSTIGHSQGAVYAYLYGDEGVETIVYNPAPFNGKKPDNTYIIRRKGDPASIFTTGNKITTLEKLSGQGLVGQHSIDSLDNKFYVFGNKFVYSEDKEYVEPKDSNSTFEALHDDTINKPDNTTVKGGSRKNISKKSRSKKRSRSRKSRSRR